jgi:spermidine/putrescine transport system substrate-binding protein
MAMHRKQSSDNLRFLAPTRREALSVLASAGVIAIPFLVPTLAAKAADDHPILFTYAGYDIPEFYPTYVEKYGRPPEFAFFNSEDEAIAKMRAGYQPDVVFPCTYKIVTWYDAGLIGPIDTNKLSNWPDLFDSLKNIDGMVRDGQQVLVPTDWGQTSVTFRTDLAPEYVDNESLDILWDPKYAGRIALFDSPVDGVLFAAIREGIDPFNMGDEEIEIVRRSLEEQRPLLRFYADNETIIEQALASG